MCKIICDNIFILLDVLLYCVLFHSSKLCLSVTFHLPHAFRVLTHSLCFKTQASILFTYLLVAVLVLNQISCKTNLTL